MKKSDTGLLIQAVLAFFILVFGILYFIEKETLPILQILFALFMFILAYNNQTTYKRKYITIIYLLCGITILGVVFLG